MSTPMTGQFASLYRLVSPTVNVKHGTLSANTKFNTNIPFDWGMFIYRVEWAIAVKDAPTGAGASYDGQVTVELTENAAGTTASNTDPLIICDAFYEERNNIATAVGQGITARNPFFDNAHNFYLFYGAPYPTVAQQLNVIATIVEVVGNPFPTNGVDVFANIFYGLQKVDPALRDYLTKRQQIQR